MLLSALLNLMKSNDFNDITIQEITNRAMLSRRTFYRNFKKKEEILDYHFNQLGEQYIDRLKRESDLQLPQITKVLFSFWKQHLQLLKLLHKQDLLHLLLRTLNKQLPTIYDHFKGQLNEYGTDEKTRYALAFSAGGFWNMMIIWLEDDAKMSPESLARIVEDSIRVNGLSEKNRS